MFIDRIKDNSRVRADVCIIGGGPAGLTIAEELENSNLDVVVLEAGDRRFDPATQQLAEGPASGPLIKGYKSYLRDSRFFHLGGAGGWWGGFCIPFADIDFAPRAWVAGSGWPFGRSELDPYYERAARSLGFTPITDARTDARRLRKLLPLEDAGALTSHVYHFPPAAKFSSETLRLWGEATRARIILNSVATRLVARDGRLDHIEVTSLLGKRFFVEAEKFVLAAGGIENARILLEAAEDASLSLNRGAVGQSFMEHFHAAVGSVRLRRSKAWELYTQLEVDGGLGHHTLAVLSLSGDLQREHKLLNYSVQLKEDLDDDRDDEFFTATCFARAEQSPNPDSRITLAADERDSLGRRKAALSWQVNAQDWSSVVFSTHLMAQELERCFEARVELSISESDPWPGEPRGPSPNLPHTWGCHHMGTTRMHRDPARGVVDPDCRVHGISNLMVAGSSVFPTSSFANPTFTLLALAIRIADQLKQQKGAGHATATTSEAVRLS